MIWVPTWLTCLVHNVACTLTRFERINPASWQPTSCICTGDVLTYECDIVGPGTTVWKGTGFENCPSQGDQILLPHILFMDGTASGECNDGSVLAKGIEVTNGQCYGSQLNITVSNHFNNMNVTCVYVATNGTQRVIGSSTIDLPGIRRVGHNASSLIILYCNMSHTHTHTPV